MNKCRIFLVEDHGVVREGIKRLLERRSDMEVVGESEDGLQALEKIQETQPDVVMMDISLPGSSGIELTQRVRQHCPSTRVIALTVHEDEGYIREILRHGAVGYLLKRIPTEELALAVRTVADGGTYIDPRVASKVVRVIVDANNREPSPSPALSEREERVLQAIAKGHSNKEIAALLNIGVKTVETYKARAMEKLGLKSRVDIVRTATARGWLLA
ncbi:MAG TPA: response regulator transcription factor [Opitutaceae bacterium]